MSDYINKLRKKPKHVRDNIAFGVAGSFTTLLALGWFLISSPHREVVPGAIAEESTPAFSTLINQFKEQMASVNDSLPAQSQANPSETVSVPATSSAVSVESYASGTQRFPKEAAIMVVPSASTTEATSSSAVLY